MQQNCDFQLRRTSIFLRRAFFFRNVAGWVANPTQSLLSDNLPAVKWFENEWALSKAFELSGTVLSLEPIPQRVLSLLPHHYPQFHHSLGHPGLRCGGIDGTNRSRPWDASLPSYTRRRWSCSVEALGKWRASQKILLDFNQGSSSTAVQTLPNWPRTFWLHPR